MDFMIQWVCYLLAFLAGSGVARVAANILNKRVSVEEVPAFSTEPAMGGQR